MLAAGGAVGIVMVLPLLHLLLRASEGSGAGAALAVVGSARVLALLRTTLVLAVVVTAASVVIGTGMAWALERVELPARRTLGVVAALPLVVPTYVGALALLGAIGPGGLVAELGWVRGPAGAAVALVASTYPYVLLPVRAALATADRSLEEAARSLGRTRLSVALGVVLPQLRPALSAGGLLVFLYVLSDFGAVAILRTDTLTRAIFLEFRSLSADRSEAAILGVVLVVLTLAAIAVERAARGRVVARSAAGAAPRPPARRGGPVRWPAAAAVAAVGGFGVGVPVVVLTAWLLRGGARTEEASVLASAASTSLGLSAAAAAAAVALALPVAVLAVRFRSAASRAVEAMALAGYALPGLVIALALVFFSIRWAPLLYQTYALVVVAYVVRFMPEALGAVRSSLGRVDPSLEEAGRSLGRSPARTTWSVTLPLVRGGLAAGAALVFLTAMKELPATLLLRPAGADTLAVRVWTGASEGFYAQAAPAGLLVLAASALVLLPLRLTSGRRAWD